MKKSNKKLLASFLLMAFANLGTPALANIESGTVLNQVGGQYGANLNNVTGATINSNGTYANITNTQTNSTLNWNTLNTAPGQTLNFNMINGQTALNRVITPSLSRFAGNLTSTGGRVIISNPMGMIFENGSYTNVNSLILTTKDAQFINNQLKLNDVGSSAGIKIGGEGSSQNAAVMRVANDLNIISNDIKINNADIFAGKNVNLVTADGVTFVAGNNIATGDTNANAINQNSIGIENSIIAVKDNVNGNIHFISKGDKADVKVANSALDGKIKIDVDGNADLSVVGNLDIKDSTIGGNLIAKTVDSSIALSNDVAEITGLTETTKTLEDYITERYGSFTDSTITAFINDNKGNLVYESIDDALISSIKNNAKDMKWVEKTSSYKFGTDSKYSGAGTVSIADTKIGGDLKAQGTGVLLNNVDAKNVETSILASNPITASRKDDIAESYKETQYSWIGSTRTDSTYKWKNNGGTSSVVTFDGEEVVWNDSTKTWTSLATGNTVDLNLIIQEDDILFGLLSETNYYTILDGKKERVTFDEGFLGIGIFGDGRWEANNWRALGNILGLSIEGGVDCLAKASNVSDKTAIPTFTPTASGISIGNAVSVLDKTKVVLNGGTVGNPQTGAPVSVEPKFVNSSSDSVFNTSTVATNAIKANGRFTSIKAAAANVELNGVTADTATVNGSGIVNFISSIFNKKVEATGKEKITATGSTFGDETTLGANEITADGSTFTNSTLSANSFENAIKNSTLDSTTLKTTVGNIKLNSTDNNTIKGQTVLNSVDAISLNGITTENLDLSATNNININDISSNSINVNNANTFVINNANQQNSIASVIAKATTIDVDNLVAGTADLTSTGITTIDNSNISSLTADASGDMTINTTTLGSANITNNSDWGLKMTDVTMSNDTVTGLIINATRAKLTNVSNTGKLSSTTKYATYLKNVKDIAGLTINSTQADVQIDGITLASGNIKVDAGTYIDAKNITNGGDITLKTHRALRSTEYPKHGDIYLDNIQANKIDATANFDITANNLQIANDSSLKAADTLKLTNTSNFKVKASAADITLDNSNINNSELTATNVDIINSDSIVGSTITADTINATVAKIDNSKLTGNTTLTGTGLDTTIKNGSIISNLTAKDMNDLIIKKSTVSSLNAKDMNDLTIKNSTVNTLATQNTGDVTLNNITSDSITINNAKAFVINNENQQNAIASVIADATTIDVDNLVAGTANLTSSDAMTIDSSKFNKKADITSTNGAIAVNGSSFNKKANITANNKGMTIDNSTFNGKATLIANNKITIKNNSVFNKNADVTSNNGAVTVKGSSFNGDSTTITAKKAMKANNSTISNAIVNAKNITYNNTDVVGSELTATNKVDINSSSIANSNITSKVAKVVTDSVTGSTITADSITAAVSGAIDNLKTVSNGTVSISANNIKNSTLGANTLTANAIKNINNSKINATQADITAKVVKKSTITADTINATVEKINKSTLAGDTTLTGDDLNSTITNSIISSLNAKNMNDLTINDSTVDILSTQNTGNVTLQGLESGSVTISGAKDVVLQNSTSQASATTPTILELAAGQTPIYDYNEARYNAGYFENQIVTQGNRYGADTRVSYISGDVNISDVDNINIINAIIEGNLTETNYTGESNLITAYVGGAFTPDRTSTNETSVYESYIGQYTPYYMIPSEGTLDLSNISDENDRKRFGSEINVAFQRQFTPRGFAAADDEIAARMNRVRSTARSGNNNSILLTERFMAE